MRTRYAIAILLALSLLAGCTSVPTETETEAETKPDLPPVTETDTAKPETESEPETVAPYTTPEREPYPDAPYHYTLSADVYPTLDFTYHADYMNFALCDFAILENGNLLLLTMNESVTEIAPDGMVIGTYTYPLTENGMTAYRIAADGNGNFYFLDGRNNAIHKADRNGILRTIQLDKPDLAATRDFYAVGEDTLLLENYNDDLIRSVFTLDVSGDSARIVGDVLPGVLLSDGYRTEMTFIPDNEGEIWDGGMTRRLSITLYNGDGAVVFSYAVTGNTSDFAVMAGISPICMLPDETVLAKVLSFAEGDRLCVSVVRFGKDGILGASATDPNPNDNLIRNFGGISYLVRHPENGLEIVPVTDIYTDFTAKCPYTIAE